MKGKNALFIFGLLIALVMLSSGCSPSAPVIPTEGLQKNKEVGSTVEGTNSTYIFTGDWNEPLASAEGYYATRSIKFKAVSCFHEGYMHEGDHYKAENGWYQLTKISSWGTPSVERITSENLSPEEFIGKYKPFNTAYHILICEGY